MPYFYAQDGAQIYYQDEGSGLPILALAGLTRNSSDFDYIAPHLEGIRLMRMDYRGRGRSEWTGPETYTIPKEGADAVALLDHLNLSKAAILGTSRGGLIAMGLAATSKDRLLGAALVDIGPEISVSGMTKIRDYIGRNPTAKTFANAAQARAQQMPEFANVPDSRWREEAEKHYCETGDGLTINYDPDLALTLSSPNSEPLPDLWPFFDLLADLPLALIRGENSDLLAKETAAEMLRRRPDMIFSAVPDRGHVPFLDEAPSIRTITRWIEAMK